MVGLLCARARVGNPAADRAPRRGAPSRGAPRRERRVVSIEVSWKQHDASREAGVAWSRSYSRLRRCKERHGRPAFGGNELHSHVLADFHGVEVAIDDVGHHRGPLRQGDIGHGVRRFGALHDADRVNLALAGGGFPCAFAEAVRAKAARVPMRLAALGAAADHQLAGSGAVEERLGFRVRLGRSDERDLALNIGHIDYSRSRITVLPQWRVPSEPPVPWAMARSQFFTCTAGWASPRNCRTASMILVMPPRLAGWLEQSPPPSVLKGSLPTPEIRLPSATNLPPLPFSAKPRSSSCISTVMVKLSYIDA